MSNNEPITPPLELVKQWRDALFVDHDMEKVATQAAQWGAEQELEACCEWVQGYAECGDSLRAARRPKPLNLKEQALATLSSMQIDPVVVNGVHLNADVMAKYDIIRRALEQLDD